MPRALMAVAPRTTELVEYKEPPLGDRAQQHAGVGQPVPRPSAVGRPSRRGDRLHLMREGRLQSDGLVHPIVSFEQSNEPGPPQYNGESFASSYPESQDIYLGEVWKVDEQGRFQSRIDATMGALVNHDVIDYLNSTQQEDLRMKHRKNTPRQRVDDWPLHRRGYTPKTTVPPEKIVPPKGGTGETTLATRPSSSDDTPQQPKKD